MLTIRLQRVGRKGQPVFRIVLAEKHRAAAKKAVEILGFYNPRTKDFGLRDEERLRYWVDQHVEISPTVHNLFLTKGLVTGQKMKAWRPKVKAKVEQPAAATPKAEVEVKTETAPQATT